MLHDSVVLFGDSHVKSCDATGMSLPVLLNDICIPSKLKTDAFEMKSNVSTFQLSFHPPRRVKQTTNLREKLPGNRPRNIQMNLMLCIILYYVMLCYFTSGILLFSIEISKFYIFIYLSVGCALTNIGEYWLKNR